MLVKRTTARGNSTRAYAVAYQASGSLSGGESGGPFTGTSKNGMIGGTYSSREGRDPADAGPAAVRPA